jgi:predicted transcriptional regulator
MLLPGCTTLMNLDRLVSHLHSYRSGIQRGLKLLEDRGCKKEKQNEIHTVRRIYVKPEQKLQNLGSFVKDWS